MLDNEPSLGWFCFDSHYIFIYYKLFLLLLFFFFGKIVAASYVAEQYDVDLGSLVEARLDLRSWEPPRDEDEDEDEDESDESDGDSDTEAIFGDVTGLVAGISKVKTLHLSSDSLEVFHNLLTLSFESDKERGWQVVPLLINNSPNLDNLIIKGLVHQVTDRCRDACSCIPKRRVKKKMMEKGVCCLSTCRVKVLHISGYRRTCGELKHMRHFLANLKCLETVKVGVKVNPRQDNHRMQSHQCSYEASPSFIKL